MEYAIYVNALKLYGYHGVYEQERTVGNVFIYDVRVDYDFSEAALNDDLEGSINYAGIVEVIRQVNDKPSRLLENVAWRLCRSLKDTWPGITGGSIKIAKPAPPIAGIEADSVAVSISF